MNKPFNSRAFTALLMTFSFVGLPITGLANHYLGFEPMGVPRHAWMTAHNVLAIIFTASAVWHLVLNRQAWMRHVRGLADKMPTISREAICAACAVLVVTGVMVSHAFHAGGGERHGHRFGQSQAH